MKNVIVTGANGFVGSAVVKELIKHNIKVYAIVRNHKDKITNLTNVEIFSCELSKISNLKNILPDIEYDAFYHFAWEGISGEKRFDIELQLSNIKWSIDTLKIAKVIGCKKFICAGSMMEYEAIYSTYFEKDCRARMDHIYGSSKINSRIISMAVSKNIGIDLIYGYITNAYGVSDFSTRLINSTLNKIIHGESPKFTSGTQNYDFVYIDDVARAFYLIGKNGKPFSSYVIGSSNAKPLKEFLMEIKNLFAPDLEFIFGGAPFLGIDLPLEMFDTENTEKDTGFKAKVTFEEGVKRTMDWLIEYYKNN